MDPGPDRRSAVEEVRAHLVAIRGGAPFLSPADGWQLLRWLDGGVPVSAILRAIEAAATARRARRARTPLGLAHARKYLEPAKLQEIAAIDRRGVLVARIREISEELGPLCARLEQARVADAEALARLALTEIRALHERAWEALEPGERAALLADARAGYGAMLEDLAEAVQHALIEEAARDRVRARWPGLCAELVWESLRLSPLEAA